LPQHNILSDQRGRDRTHPSASEERREVILGTASNRRYGTLPVRSVVVQEIFASFLEAELSDVCRHCEPTDDVAFTSLEELLGHPPLVAARAHALRAAAQLILQPPDRLLPKLDPMISRLACTARSRRIDTAITRSTKANLASIH
jgi:hypothetical protein